MTTREAYQFSKPGDRELDRPFQRQDKLHEPLYVITPIFNAARYRSRWRLYADFKKMVAEAGAILYTIEVAFGDRDFVVTSPDDPFSIQLRTPHELWLKEAMINLAVARLPLGWKKVAWVDADCHFARYDWANETLHLLERYPVIQMWSQLHDLNAEHELQGMIKSFGSVWIENGGKVGGPDPEEVAAKFQEKHGNRPCNCPCPCPCPKPPDPYPYPEAQDLGKTGKRKAGYPGAPGLAWAMRREAWDQLGGLVDYCILGAGDWYMAHALTGQSHRVVRPEQGRLGEMLLEWEDRARTSLWAGRPILGNLGVMKGVCFHYWHGPKANRLYGTREKILAENEFNPDLDLKRDWQGLYQVTNRKPQLRRDLQWYASQRNEDALT